VTPLLAALLTLSAIEATAQSTALSEVRAVIDQLFAGMREADSAKVRATFAQDARFALLPRQDAAAGVVRYLAVDGWLRAIAGSEKRWDERIYDVEIRVDDTLASAWTPYTFYLDGAIRHCGVNSFSLLRTAEGWKITQVSDTQRTEGCRDVPR
jgi:hypothetical protein